MLKINFLNPTVTNESLLSFAKAVRFSRLQMEAELLADQIAQLSRKIDNKAGKFSEEEIKAFEKKKLQLEVDLEDTEELQEGLEEDFNTVVEIMTTKPEGSEYANPEEAVKNVLRVMGAAENPKLEKYALKTGIGSGSLYEALQTCHSLKNTSETGSGMVKQTKAVKEAYAQAEKEIQDQLRSVLSLPIETLFTGKLRVKFGATDLRQIHESYVLGYQNDYLVDTDKDGNETSRVVKAVKARTLVVKKEGKNGEAPKYNFGKLAAVITRIVIQKISA